MRRRDIEERFLEKAKAAESGCLEWQSTLHRDGYGKFWFDGKQEQAHRAAWRIFKGAIPKDRWVLHDCDNRLCVRLDHLYLGTPAQNTEDMHRRGRAVGNRRLSEAAVAWAREAYNQRMSQTAIAAKLGVHQTQISRIVRGVQRRSG